MASNPGGDGDVPGSTVVLDPQAPLSAAFRESVNAALTVFLAGQRAVLDELGPELTAVHRLAGQLLSGGKRLRPAFAVWSYVGACGLPVHELDGLLAAAASLELLHVSALVHDDVMDSSDLRRGRPAAHRQFETLHRDAGWLGDPQAYGRAGAILLGDLLLMWSVELAQRSGLPEKALARGLPILEAMRTEVTAGQYLDIVAQARPWPASPQGPEASVIGAAEQALAEADRVVEFKSARYTVSRPCQLGAALGGGSSALHRSLAEYGSPLGRAFQFRDDLLGVFGDPQVTGKPTGDDLREGKRTVLVAHAFAHASPSARRLLVATLGDPALDAAGVAALQQVIADSGAMDACEARISEGYQRALAALDGADLSEEGRTALTAMADAAVHRVL
ncbi:MAG TPA: polyprenyl synthetase family protein [Propionibacteriaceae bacterium]|nr:polyprenyl synthetase family protein [Propionibacteriaceae bacterium]